LEGVIEVDEVYRMQERKEKRRGGVGGMVEGEKRMGIVEEIKKQEIKANLDELGKRSVGSGSIGSAASSMLNLLGARVLAFSHLNIILFLSILFFSLFLLFPSCCVEKKKKEKIDFTYTPPSVLDSKDSDPSIKPGAAEICNGIDDNCNGQVDECVTATYYRDNDGDGFGDPISNADSTSPNPITICSTDSPPPGYVSNNTDCDDNDPLINPTTRWYKDADGDGYTDGVNVIACIPPSGYVLSALPGDCNDNNPSIYPKVWYRDQDRDGYTDGVNVIACIPPSGYVLSALPGDCNDNNPSIYPNTVWYKDADGDGYTDGSTYVNCYQPPFYVLSALSGDCDDSRADVNPDQTEICDEEDQNCDGQYNEGIPCPLLQVVGWTAFSADLRWADPFISEQYFVLEVSTNTSFAGTITRVAFLAGTTGITISNFDGTRTYYFRLKAIGSGNRLLGYSNVVSAQEFFADVLTAGGFHNCAIKKDGSLWCWGANWGGQLGDTAPRNTPEQVMALSATPVVSLYELGAGYMILLFGKLWGEKLPIMGGPLLSIRYDLFDMWRGRILGMEDVAVRLGGKTRLGTAGSLQKGKQSIFYLLDVLSINLSTSGKLNLFRRKSNLNLSVSTANFGINSLTYGRKRGFSINPVSINIDFSLAFDLKNFGTGIFLFLNPIDVFSTNTFLDENDNEIYGVGKLRMIRLASGFILLF
jgi:hypothetical protein